jgi:multiple sugar transport system substrate-binding protein
LIGYIAAARKLNLVLRPQGIEEVHLTGASHSPDVWYPYLWVLGRDIIKQKSDIQQKDHTGFHLITGQQELKLWNLSKLRLMQA